MKKNFSLRKRAAILLTVFFLIGINSCRKHEDSLNESAASINSGLTKFDFSKLKPAVRIQMSEVYNWLSVHISAGDQTYLQMDSIQQTYADYHHVIKIPINQYAALFFTKENGQLKAFAYKWDDAKPGAKLYTGHIESFSFQDPTVRAFKYYKGKKIIDQTLNTSVNFGGVDAGPNNKVLAVTDAQGASTKLKMLGFFGDLWCLLTNGVVGGPHIASGGNNCDRSSGNGWISQVVTFIRTIFDGGGSEGGDDGDNGSSSDYGSDPESPTNLWYGPGAYNGPSPAEGGGGGGQGTNSPASQPYQGGSFWVSRWVSDGCQAPASGDPGNGGGGGPVDLPGDDGSGCPGGSSGHWESVEIKDPIDPANSDLDFNLSHYVDINSIDNDLNDITVMPNYNGQTPDDNITYDFDPLVDANFVDIVVDTTFSSNTKLNTVYNVMTNNYTIQKALSKFFGKKNPISLTLRAKILGPLTRGLTTPIGDPSNPYTNRIIIDIDPNKAALRPDLMVAKTIIHEIIHAEIFRILQLKKQGILPNEYNKILNALLLYYRSYPKANPKINAYWDHGYMAQHYLSTIAKALQEYDTNPNVPLCFYKMLAWEGLENTPYYNKMSATDIQKINDAINAYNTSQTISPCIN